MFVLWGLSLVYAAYGNIPWIAAVFYGLKPAVMAIVACAVIRIGQKALKNTSDVEHRGSCIHRNLFLQFTISGNRVQRRLDRLHRRTLVEGRV